MEENYDPLFKIALAGDSKVGKTNMFTQFFNNEFDHFSKPTIACEFDLRYLTIKENTIIKAQVWDTAGLERFQPTLKTYYKRVVGAIIVYDITNYESFKNVKKWITEVQEYAERDCIFRLVGNKTDLKELREVKSDEAIEYAQNEGLKFMEVSAKDDKDIEGIFYFLANEILNKILTAQKKKEEEKQNGIYKIISKEGRLNKCY